MNNLTKILHISGAVLAVTVPTASIADSLDKYQIRWGGSEGTKFYGSYTIRSFTNTKSPTRFEDIKALVPYKVDLSLPKDSIVSAYGKSVDGTTMYVTIYKNGKNCGRVVLVGSSIGANKTCN